MKFKKESILLMAFICTLAFCSSLYAEQPGSLTADTVTYDSNTKRIEASGNVVLKRGQSMVNGDIGTGMIALRVFEVTGKVGGVFPEYDMRLETAESLKWTEIDSGGQIEVSGKVRLARGKSDYLRASYVRWILDTDNYYARGNVNMRWDGHILRAAEAQRTGSAFYGVGVRRYENIARKTGMAADRVDGTINGGEMREVVAVGNVVIDHVGADGIKTNLTGAKAVYTMESDSLVVSGGAEAIRSDGNTVSSEKIIMHVGTNRIEAVGSASLSFKAGDSKDRGNKNKQVPK